MKKLVLLVGLLLGALLWLWKDGIAFDEQMTNTVEVQDDGKEFVSQFGYGEGVSVDLAYIEPLDKN